MDGQASEQIATCRLVTTQASASIARQVEVRAVEVRAGKLKSGQATHGAWHDATRKAQDMQAEVFVLWYKIFGNRCLHSESNRNRMNRTE